VKLFTKNRLIALCAFQLAFAAGSALAQDMTFFRIGTGGPGGTYYPVAGVIAQAISNPPGARPCEKGGSCGGPGLVAVAQSSNGSVSNIKGIASGILESGFAQSDTVYWAYTGTGVFKGEKPVENLRAIANLYPESMHVVARKGSGIHSVRDLRGKRVSLDEPGSGTLIDARLILGAYGLAESDVKAEYIKPILAAEKIKAGTLDAFFIVAGHPVPSIVRLVAEAGAILVPVSGPEAKALVKKNRFLSRDIIPGDTYPGIGKISTVSVGAEWIVGASVDASLVYEITKTIWNEQSRKLLDGGHPKGKIIVIENALSGLGIPLHPGAERYYREAGLMK